MGENPLRRNRGCSYVHLRANTGFDRIRDLRERNRARGRESQASGAKRPSRCGGRHDAKIAPRANWIFFRDTDDFEQAADKLISALDTIGGF